MVLRLEKGGSAIQRNAQGSHEFVGPNVNRPLLAGLGLPAGRRHARQSLIDPGRSLGQYEFQRVGDI